MRILRLAPYVTIPRLLPFARTKTGFGRSVWDISRASVAAGQEVHLFTYKFTPATKLEGVRLTPHQLGDALLNLQLSSLTQAMHFLTPMDQSVKRKLRTVRRFLSSGYVKRLIQTVKPDLIHVHGVTVDTIPLISAAVASGLPAVFTLHGLNAIGMDDADPYERQLESSLVASLNEKGYPITVVGSGIRNKILQEVTVAHPGLLITVTDGVDFELFSRGETRAELRSRFGIKPDQKVILCVGSLCRGKNQAMLVQAMALLPEELREQLVCFLVGDGRDRTTLEKLVQEFGLVKSVLLTGYLELEEVARYYRMADLTAVVSLSEGFGRPFLESFAAGTPVITFPDLDAIPDLQHDACLHYVPSRTANALAAELRKALSTTWNHDDIQSWARNFTWEVTVAKYMEVYTQTGTERKGCTISSGLL